MSEGNSSIIQSTCTGTRNSVVTSHPVEPFWTVPVQGQSLVSPLPTNPLTYSTQSYGGDVGRGGSGMSPVNGVFGAAPLMASQSSGHTANVVDTMVGNNSRESSEHTLPSYLAATYPLSCNATTGQNYLFQVADGSTEALAFSLPPPSSSLRLEHYPQRNGSDTSGLHPPRPPMNYRLESWGNGPLTLHSVEPNQQNPQRLYASNGFSYTPAFNCQSGGNGVPCFVSTPSADDSQCTAGGSAPASEAITRSRTNLFVRNLPPNMTDASLRELFSAYGEIASTAVMLDIHTGESLGNGFVRFTTQQAAEDALRDFPSSSGGLSKLISVSWARQQHDGAPVGEARRKIKKLFARNIPTDVTTDMLRKHFSPYGHVNTVTIHNDTAPRRSGAPIERRIAFVTFSSEGCAEKAADAVHNTLPFSSCNGIPLMVKLASDASTHLKAKAASDRNTSLHSITGEDFPLGAESRKRGIAAEKLHHRNRGHGPTQVPMEKHGEGLGSSGFFCISSSSHGSLNKSLSGTVNASGGPQTNSSMAATQVKDPNDGSYLHASFLPGSTGQSCGLSSCHSVFSPGSTINCSQLQSVNIGASQSEIQVTENSVSEPSYTLGSAPCSTVNGSSGVRQQVMGNPCVIDTPPTGTSLGAVVGQNCPVPYNHIPLAALSPWSRVSIQQLVPSHSIDTDSCAPTYSRMSSLLPQGIESAVVHSSAASATATSTKGPSSVAGCDAPQFSVVLPGPRAGGHIQGPTLFYMDSQGKVPYSDVVNSAAPTLPSSCVFCPSESSASAAALMHLNTSDLLPSQGQKSDARGPGSYEAGLSFKYLHPTEEGQKSQRLRGIGAETSTFPW